MQLMNMSGFETTMIYVVLSTALVALLYAGTLSRQILKYDRGTDAMQRVWRYIKTGANAYLKTQLRTVVVMIVILTGAMFFSVWIIHPSAEARELFGDNARTIIALGRAGAFLMGSSFSALVGYLGMNMAVEGNVRVAAASRISYSEALKIAYRSGTITGMLTDGLGLLGGTLIFTFFGKASPDVLLGFGFGGTLLALFMRVGGGIYTKAADVGADLVGKVEAGLEEDDPRNAAVIADLVGDNVGDCAGMAADIFESYEVTIVSSLILGLALAGITGTLTWIIIPLLIRGIGVISSIIGTYAVSFWKNVDAEEAMYKSYELSSAITIIASFLLSHYYARDIRMGVLVAIGVALAVAFNPLTALATSANSKRVQSIAASSRFGPALVILDGLSLGYLSSVWAIVVIILSLAASILIYTTQLPGMLARSLLYVSIGLGTMLLLYNGLKKRWVSGLIQMMWSVVFGLFLFSMAPEAEHAFTYTLFGISLIGVGMLSHTGNNVSMDTFGPIADNANGIGELSGMDIESRQIMADLDAAGNTTKAITKGVAIGSAVIAALSLYGSFFTDIRRVWPVETRGPFEAVINLADPKVFIGLLIGGMMPLLFGGLLIKAVNRSAAEIMAEVRRQLRIPEILSKQRLPDYAKAVMISTRAAQAELIPLGSIAVLTPIFVGLLLKEQALGAFLAGVIVCGQLQAVFMANSGGAWDNAKKYVEDGHYGGKGSENHKASVVGDTVGDPLKDTAGPALNPMIKVMNLIGLIMAPIIVEHSGFNPGLTAVIVLSIVAMVWSVHRSDREIHLDTE